MHPEVLVQGLPYARRITVLKRPSSKSLVASWEIEIEGAVVTWREEAKLMQDGEAVHSRMIEGDFNTYTSRWTVSTQGDTVTVTLVAELDWGAPSLSQFVAPILERKAERALQGLLLAVGRAAIHRSLAQRKTERRIGYIFHPLDHRLLAAGFEDADLLAKRPELIESVVKWFPPFRRSVVTGVRSPLGVEVIADMILVPLMPEQILTLDEPFVLDKFLEAGRLAERYGARLLGLGAYAASVGRKGVYLAKRLRIPVTTGSSYTIAMVIEAIVEACKAVGIELKEATVAVVGATGTIGRICTQLMAREAGHLLLVARNRQRLEDLVQLLADEGAATAASIVDLDAAAANADVIITATNTPAALIDVTKLRPGAIVCDVSRPRNVSEENALLRPDVLVLDGGVVKPPGEVDFHFSFGIAPGLAYACMAEPMILAMEGRYESFSLGGDIDLAKVEEISQLGRKHGFTLAGLRSFDGEVSAGLIERVRKARTRARRRRAASVLVR
jgi:predicted amino acid dehydrogenase/ribosome-associated toxin RatA of RatAB toxin-antitoxin module